MSQPLTACFNDASKILSAATVNAHTDSTSASPYATFARWTIITPSNNVPEPSSIALIALAGAALAFSQRRRFDVIGN